MIDVLLIGSCAEDLREVEPALSALVQIGGLNLLHYSAQKSGDR